MGEHRATLCERQVDLVAGHTGTVAYWLGRPKEFEAAVVELATRDV